MNHPNVSLIAKNIYFIQAPMNGRFPYCNGFVFKGDQTFLIDAGLGEKLLKEIDQMMQIDTLIISHSHLDHFRDWNVLKNITLLIPEQTEKQIHQMETMGPFYTGDRHSGQAWIDNVGKPFDVTPLREPDGRFNDKDIIDIGTARIEAIHAPGHYYDHYCFLDHISGTLISTDIDFSSFGPWYGNPQGSIKEFKNSIQKLMDRSFKRVCSSHQMPIEGDAKEKFNAFLNAFDRQKNEILACLDTKKGKTLADITKESPFYHDKFINITVQHAFEGHMIQENLDLLLEEGRIRKEKDVYYL